MCVCVCVRERERERERESCVKQTEKSENTTKIDNIQKIPTQGREDVKKESHEGKERRVVEGTWKLEPIETGRK